MKTINVMRLSTEAKLPTRAHPVDAGMDLYASKALSYKAEDKILVINTEVAIEITPGYVGLVRDRSSMSKKGLKVTGGVIDAGYTGECAVVMLNLSGQGGYIGKGDKVAQMLLIPVETPAVCEVTQLGQTERGAKGFGSSGA